MEKGNIEGGRRGKNEKEKEKGIMGDKERGRSGEKQENIEKEREMKEGLTEIERKNKRNKE